MKFAVLVAGVGSRLRPLTNDRPKCLIEVGGQSILERLLTQADQTKAFDGAILVTGYFRDKVEQTAAKWNRQAGQTLPVQTVHNPKFEETNNGYSLWCARDHLLNGFVLSDGDLVLDCEILARVAGQSEIAAESVAVRCEKSLLAVDMRSRLDEEAMKFVLDDQGGVMRLSKEISTLAGEGESIGLCRIASTDAPIIVEQLDRLVQNGEVNEYYERAFQEYLSAGWRPAVEDVGDLNWVEIDDLSDLRRAEAVFPT